MTVARSVAEVLNDHVAFEVECIDRMYLNVYVPGLQYGGTIFEGLKVYRHRDGSLAAFRPDANAARFRGSARRMGMPELPDELFFDAITGLVEADHHWVPAAGGEESLYLRPFLIATTPSLVPTAVADGGRLADIALLGPPPRSPPRPTRPRTAATRSSGSTPLTTASSKRWA